MTCHVVRVSTKARHHRQPMAIEREHPIPITQADVVKIYISQAVSINLQVSIRLRVRLKRNYASLWEEQLRRVGELANIGTHVHNEWRFAENARRHHVVIEINYAGLQSPESADIPHQERKRLNFELRWTAEA